MIITKTPFRISFFGDGTDKKEFFLRNGGAVLSTTFNKYCYVKADQKPHLVEYATEFSGMKTECGTDGAEFQSPAIRNAMEMLDVHEINLDYETDLPVRSGLGSSSSFAVGMLYAFHTLKGTNADKKKLADEAIYLERILCQEAGGWQDQIAASFGGLNRINFDTNGYEVIPIVISPERKKQLNQNLMMFSVGPMRLSSDVDNINKINEKDKITLLKEMYTLVNEAERVLTDQTSNLNDFGFLLNRSWKLRRKIGAVVPGDNIDSLYAKGIEAGALGGELLGACIDGFLVFYVEPEKQEAVHFALRNLTYIPFEFENDGTRVIHHTKETTKCESKETHNGR